jgi:hypothetical protein
MFRAAPGVAVGTIIQRLVLSQWALTLAFLCHDYNSIPLRSLTSEDATLAKVKGTLADLESCRELQDRCSYLIRKNLSQLGITVTDNSSRTSSTANISADAEILQLDWAFIWQELRHSMYETERLLNLRLANLSVLVSKRSRDDSARAWVDSQRSARLS